MPMLFNTTTSKKINALCAFDEVVFYRLLMVVDGYDNYHADPKILKSILFPIKDTVRIGDINAALHNLSGARLIELYVVDGKYYLHIIDGKQKLPIKHQKFPLMPGQVVKEKVPKRKNTNTNTNTKESETRDARTLSPEFKKNLYEIAINNFKDYFPEEEKRLRARLQIFAQQELSPQQESDLRKNHVEAPINREIDKFINFNLSTVFDANALQLNTLWFKWLDRKLAYEKKTSK